MLIVKPSMEFSKFNISSFFISVFLCINVSTRRIRAFVFYLSKTMCTEFHIRPTGMISFSRGRKNEPVTHLSRTKWHHGICLVRVFYFSTKLNKTTFDFIFNQTFVPLSFIPLNMASCGMNICKKNL